MFKKIKDKEVDISSLNHILNTSKKILNIGYVIAIVALITLFTYLIKEWKILTYIKEFLVVISPIFIGFIIAWLLEPQVKLLEKNKVPKLLACVLVYLVFIGVIFLICYLFIPTFMNQLKDFIKEIPSIFTNLTDFVSNFINRFDNGGIIQGEMVKEQIIEYFNDFSVSITSNLPKHIYNIGKSIVNGGINFVLGLMIGFYLLFDFNKVNAYIHSLLPKKMKDGYTELVNRINTSLRSYVQGVLLIMIIVFITQTIGLTIAGLEAPMLFALFCAVTDIIPYFGPYIGAIPAIIVGFTTSPITGVCVIIAILIVQLLENNFYQPLIMGHTMKLHPVTIMLGLLLFQHFFGIIGMVIATPVIACFKIFFTFFNEKYEFIEKITGNSEEDIQKELAQEIEIEK